MLHREIVIVGGGPVGISLALFLARQNMQVTLIDEGINHTADGRVLALSLASQDILSQIGVWDSTIATAIKEVEISHAGFGVSKITARALNLPELGSTVAYAQLSRQLIAAVDANHNIEFLIARVTQVRQTNQYALLSVVDALGNVSELTASWVVMAEGGNLLTNDSYKLKHDYRGQAIVARVRLAKPQQGIAYERFSGLGPLVLLPFANDFSIVWALDNALATKVMANNELLIDLLNTHYTSRFGGASLLSKPHAFPLLLKQTKKRVAHTMILIGNCAQTLHPISAQGLNLGLRDVIMLANLIKRNKQLTADVLCRFERMRSTDANRVIGFTHFLASFVDKESYGIRHLRSMGITGLGNLPLIQNKIARWLIYGS